MPEVRKIFKYNVKIEGESELTLPLGARILSVMEQNNGVVLYALVDPSVTFTKKVQIRIAGTGHEITFDLTAFKYLNSVSTYDGRLIWHIFYKE